MIWRTLFVLTAWLLSAAAWAHGDEVHDTAPPALGQAVAPRRDRPADPRRAFGAGLMPGFPGQAPCRPVRISHVLGTYEKSSVLQAHGAVGTGCA